MSELRQQVGSRIAAARRAAGLSQAELARGMGTSRRYLGALERGESAASIDLLERLAAALGVAPASFLADLTVPKAQNPAQRLAALARTLAAGASEDQVQRAERILRAYFRGLNPAPPPTRGLVKKVSKKAKKNSR